MTTPKKPTRKPASRRTLMVRVICCVLAFLMVGSSVLALLGIFA